jgi:cbb3-type cytochrome oxidase subunit 3
LTRKGVRRSKVLAEIIVVLSFLVLFILGLYIAFATNGKKTSKV